MAKKKSETPAKNESAKAPAAKKSAPTATPRTQPAIDTSAAANAAAAMVGNKAALPTGGAPQGQKKESSAFKQMKAGLNKSSGAGLGGAFGAVQQNKKPQQNFGGGKQIGRNQTFGADVNRAGVPRRTPGG
jgi:hypothetical protein